MCPEIGQGGRQRGKGAKVVEGEASPVETSTRWRGSRSVKNRLPGAGWGTYIPGARAAGADVVWPRCWAVSGFASLARE